jgi:hypothetical protein
MAAVQYNDPRRVEPLRDVLARRQPLRKMTLLRGYTVAPDFPPELLTP